MTFDHELTLIHFIQTENDMGDIISNEYRIDVLCGVQSISRSEHYAAAAHDLRPEITFIVNKYDYEGQKKVEFEGKKFNVIRTYMNTTGNNSRRSNGLGDFETLELICQEAANHGSS